MTNLRVTHLSVRQTDRQTAGIAAHKRALAHQLIHDRCLCLTHGIVLTGISHAVSIENH